MSDRINDKLDTILGHVAKIPQVESKLADLETRVKTLEARKSADIAAAAEDAKPSNQKSGAPAKTSKAKKKLGESSASNESETINVKGKDGAFIKPLMREKWIVKGEDGAADTYKFTLTPHRPWGKQQGASGQFVAHCRRVLKGLTEDYSSSEIQTMAREAFESVRRAVAKEKQAAKEKNRQSAARSGWRKDIVSRFVAVLKKFPFLKSELPQGVRAHEAICEQMIVEIVEKGDSALRGDDDDDAETPTSEEKGGSKGKAKVGTKSGASKAEKPADGKDDKRTSSDAEQDDNAEGPVIVFRLASNTSEKGKSVWFHCANHIGSTDIEANKLYKVRLDSELGSSVVLSASKSWPYGVPSWLVKGVARKSKSPQRPPKAANASKTKHSQQETKAKAASAASSETVPPHGENANTRFLCDSRFTYAQKETKELAPKIDEHRGRLCAQLIELCTKRVGDLESDKDKQQIALETLKPMFFPEALSRVCVRVVNDENVMAWDLNSKLSGPCLDWWARAFDLYEMYKPWKAGEMRSAWSGDFAAGALPKDLPAEMLENKHKPKNKANEPKAKKADEKKSKGEKQTENEAPQPLSKDKGKAEAAPPKQQIEVNKDAESEKPETEEKETDENEQKQEAKTRSKSKAKPKAKGGKGAKSTPKAKPKAKTKAKSKSKGRKTEPEEEEPEVERQSESQEAEEHSGDTTESGENEAKAKNNKRKREATAAVTPKPASPPPKRQRKARSEKR